MLNWDILYNNFKDHPRNIHTHPIGHDVPKWFYAYSDGSAICIENSKGKQESCSIKGRRKLEHDKFDVVYELYLRRERGDKVSLEASRATQNASYWFGVLYAFEQGK